MYVMFRWIVIDGWLIVGICGLDDNSYLTISQQLHTRSMSSLD